MLDAGNHGLFGFFVFFRYFPGSFEEVQCESTETGTDGLGFDFADKKGSEANDSFRVKDGKVITTTNNNGGINGGITNGMPVVFSCAVKPTPSIYKTQQTIDFINGENAEIKLVGRHDPAIIHRARVVVDSVTALVICDMLALRYGTDWIVSD